MVGVGDDYRSCASAAGRVDNSSLVARVLYKTLHGSGIGADERYDSACRYHISEAYTDKSHGRHLLFEILYLFSDLLKLALCVDHERGDRAVVAF